MIEIGKKPIVVNLFAGPGTGKSTSCAQIYSDLKWFGINCEMAREFAKDKVWEKSIGVLDDQIYIFGKQQHKPRVLMNEVDVVITDSPILFSIIYDKTGNVNFRNLIIDVFHEYENINIFLERTKPYNPKGRLQSEEKAKILDNHIKNLLDELEIDYMTVKCTKEDIAKLSEFIYFILN